MYDLNIEGIMLESELIQIKNWAESVPANGVIVEVGSFLGRSSVAWASSCDPSVTVYCIDIFNIGDNHYEIFKKNTGNLKNIIPIKGKSPHDIMYLEIPIDIFFLDADHKNPSDLDNIEYFLPFIKKGGLLCGHDYTPGSGSILPDIEKNIKLLEKRLDQPVTLYPSTSLWSFNI